MSSQPESSSEILIIKNFLTKAYAHKYLYIITLILFLAIAFFINKVFPTVYEISSTIGPIKDERSSLLGPDNPFNSLAAIGQERNLENDINSLKSFTLVSKTLNNLNLEVGYFIKENKILGQLRQLYQEAPYTVSIDKSHIQPINTKFTINIINGNTFRLTSDQDKVTLYNYIDNKIVSEDNYLKIDTICRFNETIFNKYFKFSVSLNRDIYSGYKKGENTSYFEFYHLDDLTLQYLNNLTIEPVSLNSSAIIVYFQGVTLNLTIDFLNKYLQTYLNDNLSKKNSISVNTVNFIDSQISEISDSLDLSESKLRNYRSANQVMDLSFQGQRAFEQMTQIETDRTNLQIQERYYKYILDYFDKNKNMAGLAPPSAANVTDPIMNQLIMDLLALNTEKSIILSNNNEKNLFLGQIENKIKLQKQAIIENVTNNLNTLNLSLNELNYRSDKLSREISRLPRTELNMVSIQRKFNLSDAIYTFLLQKRSEAAIKMASNYPDYEILEPARESLREIVKPKKMLNLIIALFFGLMIPTLFVILKIYFNEKVSSLFDIEHILNRPVFGIVYNNTYKTEAVVWDAPDTSISESFRNLRSNLFIKTKKEAVKVILITSSQPGDGKSFISFNLAASIASVGYKSIILDCDLRIPSLHEKFGEDNSIGISTYLNHQSSIKDIIRETKNSNLSFIPSGPIMPNSSELIEAGALDELIDHLKTKYEYIIIDTTPAGLVSDAILMMKYSFINLLICRINFTRKDILGYVLDQLSVNKIENFDVVFNDLSFNKNRYGGYYNYFLKK